MKSFFTLTIFFVIATTCFAQNDWKPGYIIKNSGDTVYGFIDNRDSRSVSKYCYFRKEESSETEKYKPEDILGFRFLEGKYIVSKKISIGDSIQTKFFEYVINGRVDIFHYKDDEEHFFIEKDGNLHELKNTLDTIVDEYGRKFERQNKEYIRVLQWLLKDGNMQSEINSTRFTSSSLTNIAEKYHNRVCDGEKCIIYKKKEKVHLQWGILLGGSLNSFDFGERLVSNYIPSSFLGCRFTFWNVFDYTEKITFSFDITLHKFSKYELCQQNYHSTIYYNNVRYDLINRGDKFNIDLKVIALKFPISVNYMFALGKVRPFIGMGLSNTFILSQNKDFIFLNFFDYFHKSIPTKLILGFNGRVGCEFVFKNKHALFCDLGYDFSKNSQTGAMIFKNRMYTIKLGYLFK